MEKTIKIDWDGKDADVVMRRLSFGERNRLLQSATKISIFGGQEKIEVNQVALMENSLLKGIKSAPFEVNSTTIQNLDADVGNLLYQEFNVINNLTPEKKD